MSKCRKTCYSCLCHQFSVDAVPTGDPLPDGLDVFVILCTSPSSLYTCRVFITVNYMQPNLRATEVPGCNRVTCLLLAAIGISTQDLVLEFAVIVNGYSPRL